MNLNDNTGKPCILPGCPGTYEETGPMDDMSGILHCTECGMRVDRHVEATED